jgi:hypothetical protein
MDLLRWQQRQAVAATVSTSTAEMVDILALEHGNVFHLKIIYVPDSSL